MYTVDSAAAQAGISVVGLVVVIVLALLGAILAAALFFGPKKRDKYKGLMAKLCAHVNFERFLLPSILKFLYVFAVIYSVASGVSQAVNGQVLVGVLTAVLSPIVLRVAFELLLLLMSIREEAAETNELLRRMQGLPLKSAPAPTQTPTNAQPQPPVQQRPMRPDPRYHQPPQQQRPMGQPQYGDYAARRAPASGADFGTARRPAVRPNEGYASGGFGAGGFTGSFAAVRPNRAPQNDFAGTSRYAAVRAPEEAKRPE